MKRNIVFTSVTVLLGTFICGCSSVKWTKVEYLSPANEINLKNSPRVKFIAADKQGRTVFLTKMIANEFVKSGQFKVDEKDPDYWIVVKSGQMFRVDTPQAALYNRNVKKMSKSNQAGGYEYIQNTDHKSSAGAASLSVAVYSVKDLVPVYYFDVALYDSDFSNGKIRSGKDYSTLFSKQIIEKFKDSFLTQKRSIETAIPKNADSVMIKAIESGDVAQVKEFAKSYIAEPFDQFMADVYAGNYKDKKAIMENKLSDYYILALAEEMGSFDIVLLKKLHAQHVATLNLTESSGLETACPNTIARIESKLKLLQALK